jgi:nucleotide-binding universal stress UspA family protein
MARTTVRRQSRPKLAYWSDRMATTTDPATQPTNTSKTISRIAVGVDGGPEGSDAVALGATLADITHAELMLVTVHPDPMVVLPEEMNWKSLEQQAVRVLSETRHALAPQARTVVETDPSVARALERVARREHRDLLVVGSSRHADEGRVRIGERTRQLLHDLSCALAIAPRGIRNRQPLELKRIGVGFDGGRESYAALSLAGSIARAAGAELQLCGVVDDRIPPMGLGAVVAGAIDRWEERIQVDMEALREFGLARARETGVPVKAEIARGRPADALLSLSERVDLLVIGSRRWGAVARLLLGSTGEALVHDSGCALLVVPRPAGRSNR